MIYTTRFLGVFALLLASFFATSAAAQSGPWQIRVRGIYVDPAVSSTVSQIGGAAAVDTAIVPELDITYFFAEHFAAELILATTRHNVAAKGTAVGDVDLGSVWLLPPTLNFQYHPNPDGKIRPYVGAGVNLTLFYGVKNGDVLDVDYKQKIGGSVQAGVDIMVSDVWFLNLDFKKIFLKNTVTIDAGLPTPVIAKVTLNPTIIGVGFGRRF